MSKVQSIIEEIKGLSLLEASELVKGLEETFGVSAAAAAVAAAPAAGGGGAAAAAPAEEKTAFNVILTAIGGNQNEYLSRENEFLKDPDRDSDPESYRGTKELLRTVPPDEYASGGT